MNLERFANIRDALPSLRDELVDSPHGPIPMSITYLADQIRATSSAEEKAGLYTLMLSECARCRNHELELHFLREQLHELGEDPFSVTSLATALSRKSETRSEALALAIQGVEMAKRQNRQVRYTLTSLARMAIAASDYKLLNNALRDLIEDANRQRVEDYKLEFDFLDQIDPNQIDKELLRQYVALG